MITINEFMDIRMQQHIAHEIYRHQIMQRIPDPFPPILPFPIPRHIALPPRANLPAAEAKLQNDDLWKQFHEVGTEMIITKSGRRMFPSMRLSISGLEDESNYCVVLEMVPIGDCRYKFSGSQWIPAGGAEPQSTQRMYLHADSPASGAHWQAQPILFNKVKLTNNTLDSSGHIVLASMHKYQPRIHIIRTSDPTQIPWSPQKAFFFSETEFVAVTAYQNDRITKLKIDNNPFAKGFRETGQSRCKRKMCSIEIQVNQKLVDSLSIQNNGSENQQNEGNSNYSCAKRMRSNGSSCSVLSIDEVGFSLSVSSNNSSGRNSPSSTDIEPSSSSLIVSNRAIDHNAESLISPSFINCPYFERPQQFSDNPSLYLNLHELPIKCLASTEIDCNTRPMVRNPEVVDESKALRSNKFSISAILGSKS